MTLTDAGWPRPRVGGYPVPWFNYAEDLRVVQPARYRACASGAVCSVCGVGYQDDEQAYAFVSLEQHVDPDLVAALRSGPDPDLAAHWVSPMDNSVMHERCARLALAWCPKLAALVAGDQLYLLRVTANCADVDIPPHDPRPRGWIGGWLCHVVPMPPTGTRDHTTKGPDQ